MTGQSVNSNIRLNNNIDTAKLNFERTKKYCLDFKVAKPKFDTIEIMRKKSNLKDNKFMIVKGKIISLAVA